MTQKAIIFYDATVFAVKRNDYRINLTKKKKSIY